MAHIVDLVYQSFLCEYQKILLDCGGGTSRIAPSDMEFIMKNLTLSLQCRRATDPNGVAGGEPLASEWHRKWHLAHPGKKAEYQRKWRQNNTDNQTLYKKEWREKNIAKNAAHLAVHHALEDGKLLKQLCWICGEQKSEAHHASYAEDMRLCVTWLCRKHHKEAHLGY